ncbi:MAG: hypothetical protein N4J56_001713 [Chroococcidiopsis sp. SAG 2025]|uniref:hypothetical protein n=1 Tax=Chroococcidiopsis sp. SAG 2025 TaxID=171389 RepID=UPI0029370F40|nr:hypothetical protein [Chroococcidiopsis sp. SAG 2025]MDV2992059.1 hypothetical protein [Chroococcidiopsis sp. SAG 2025]
MPTSNSNLKETAGVKVLFFSIPNNVILQLGTSSLLLELVGGKAVAQAVTAIGQASEEVFRGDRLPVLPFPETETTSEPSDA